MRRLYFISGLIIGVIFGLMFAYIIFNAFGYELWDYGYVESLKLCVNSHDFNSVYCLYHKPW
jgi:hypothetical protein